MYRTIKDRNSGLVAGSWAKNATGPGAARARSRRYGMTSQSGGSLFVPEAASTKAIE